MLDQAEKFKSKGLRVGYVGEGQHDPTVSDQVMKGQCQLVLISPEAIINDTPYRDMLLKEVYQKRIVGIAVDEAHCVQTWYARTNLFLSNNYFSGVLNSECHLLDWEN